MDIEGYISSGAIEMYVLGLCTGEEKAGIEALARQYPAIREAITKYEVSLETGLQAYGDQPPPSVDEKIIRRIEKLQPPVVELHNYKSEKSSFNRLKFVAAAAILLLLVSAGLNFILYQKLDRQTSGDTQTTTTNSLPESDYAVMLNPAITPVAMYGQGVHAICRCTLYWDKKTGKAYVMIHHLAGAASSKDYQLWSIVDGRPVSVGLIDENIRGRFIELDNVPADAQGFMVTLEKAGGSTEPTQTAIYLKGTI